jgi:gluconate kinase
MNISEEPRCWYCDQEECDHVHGDGHSCGNCCSMHGGLTFTDDPAYKWVEQCIRSKNERIAQAEQALSALEARITELEKALAKEPA